MPNAACFQWILALFYACLAEFVGPGRLGGRGGAFPGGAQPARAVKFGEMLSSWAEIVYNKGVLF